MTGSGFELFETKIGSCGLAWGRDSLIGAQLPEKDSSRALARLAERFPEACLGPAPEWVLDVAARVAALLGGSPDDLSDVPLDLARVRAFEAQVYRAARAIPPGRTSSYGAIAEALGDRTLARAVGQALGRNPWPIIIPCHRVTAADGRTGGFSAPGGISTKLRLLEIEGALAPESLPLFSRPPSAA